MTAIPCPYKDANLSPKAICGYYAVDKYVESGMIVGLGTGSTAEFAVRRVAERIQNGDLTNMQFVVSSTQTEALAKKLSLPMIPLHQANKIDVYLDGADCICSKKNLVKGRGAALLREKMIANASSKFIVIADDSKLTWKKTKRDGLGHDGSLPIEVVRFESEHTMKQIKNLKSYEASKAVFRENVKGENLVTDNSNYIVDAFYKDPISNLKDFNSQLLHIPGVVETGLFLDMADVCVICNADGNLEIF